MQLVSAFLADDIRVNNGVLSTVGAFPEWWTVPHLPARQSLNVGLVISMRPDEVEFEYDLHLRVGLQGSEDSIGTAEIRTARGPSPQAIEGTPLYQFVVFNLTVIIEKDGAYEAEIFAGDKLLGTVPFGVRVSFVP
jgi:hypothetical protein